MQALLKSLWLSGGILNAGVDIGEMAGWLIMLLLAAVLFPYVRKAAAAMVLKLYELIIQKNTFQL